jgi:hypothetical protein
MDDEIDNWVLDEDFVRSGPHEPPARTRAAIARHGGKQTSWRQPGVPAGMEVTRRPAGSIERQLGRSGGGANSASRLLGRWILIVGACVGVLSLVLWVRQGPGARPGALGALQGTDALRPISPAGQAPVVRSAGTLPSERDRVTGISPATPVGSCFTADTADPHNTQPQPITLHSVTCAVPHNYELVTIRSASGSSKYPPDGYWNQTVMQACQRDYQVYTGHASKEETTNGRTVGFFRPTVSGWSFGDRTVYCVAHSPAPLAGSTHG